MNRSKEKIIKDIKEVIEEIKFYISMDGGDLEFIDFDMKNGIVKIKLGGACVGCELVDHTYNDSVKEILVNEISEVNGIEIL